MANKILVVTVGMGSNEDPQRSLYEPIERSLKQEPIDQIWLFPWQLSLMHAEHLKRTLSDLPIRIAPPLPSDAEENPSDCFSFFQARFDEVLTDGERPENVTLDYTRGTKTMSAAAMLAGVSRGIERFCYVSGVRGANNLVTPGTERVRKFSAAYISADREMALAMELMKLQRYGPVATVMERWESRYPQDLHTRAEHLVACARFWDAWDRLEYKEAAQAFASTQAKIAWYTPSEAGGKAVAFLSQDRPQTPSDLCAPTWALVFDVMENARRRLKHGQYEDALLRIYRSLELLGQAELYRYGIETNGADPNHEEIKKWIAYRTQKGKSLPVSKPGRGYELSKDWVGSLLKHLNSGLAQGLNNFDKDRGLQAKDRNTSLLIHGFAVRATSDRLNDMKVMLESALPQIARKGVPVELRWIEESVRFPHL